jgi:hypothetical protein
MAANVLIDQHDIYAEYGVILLRGSYDGLLQPPKRKTSLSNNWQDEDGLDIDLTEPHWEEKDVDLKFLLVAPDETTWWANYTNFFALVQQFGRRVLQVSELKMSFDFYYKEVDNYTQLTTITNTKLIAAQFTLKVGI